ncbi:MAG TPA: FAD binding domain-containing protein, partial [Nannocystaceae bacterium]|nr:FAD binding domain-containing protein [Nannocystaceae bacterium]
MIVFPTTVEDAATSKVEFRAGGTDLQERRALRIAGGDLVDLRDLRGLAGIAMHERELQIGAGARIQSIADHAGVRAHFGGLAAAAGGLATPQIRRVATLAGNLLQRPRCWYFRNPDVTCLKRGGSECLARAGDHHYHACFDVGPCVAVHASTLGMALLAYDARVTVVGGESLTIAELYGAGKDPTREHVLAPGMLVTDIVVPRGRAGERSAYFRTIARARAEWPLVEALVRIAVKEGAIESAAVAVGAVAAIPLRLAKVEAALVGRAPEPAVLAAAAKQASDGASPLPMTGYKLAMLEAT